jgi:hypothetical protein
MLEVPNEQGRLKMNQTLHNRNDICAARKRGRTAQISDENKGLWPAPTFYRGRTPLWTDSEVERGLKEEIERLSAESVNKRGDLQSDMRERFKSRSRNSQLSNSMAA